MSDSTTTTTSAPDKSGTKAEIVADGSTTVPVTAVTLTVQEHQKLLDTIAGYKGTDEKRKADEKAKADEEAKKRGEHEKLLTQRDEEIKVLKPWQDKYSARVKTEHDRRMTAIAQCDDKIKAQFKQVEKGGELTLEDMERNLAKLDEYEALGLLTPKGGGDGNTVVVPAAGQQHVTTKADNSPRTFDPWKS